MQYCSRAVGRVLVLGCLTLAAVLLDGAVRQQAVAEIIYFTEVTSRLKLDGQQRPKVEAIVKGSEAATLAIFAKHGIDPHATPDPKKLIPARAELEAIGHRERTQLKQILDPSQLKKYDAIMKRLRSKVARAAAGNQ
jgi:hypothetical protein